MMRLLSAYLAEELRIAFGNEDVVLRLMKLQHFVRMIEALGALLPCVEMRAHGLPGPAHAAAGAGHHFDQVVVALASPYLFGDDAGIAQSVNNSQFELSAIESNRGLAQA